MSLEIKDIVRMINRKHREIMMDMVDQEDAFNQMILNHTRGRCSPTCRLCDVDRGVFAAVVLDKMGCKIEEEVSGEGQAEK